MKKAKRETRVFSGGVSAAAGRSAKRVRGGRWSRYQSLFDSAALSIIETDLSGRIIDCNPGLANQLLTNPEAFTQLNFAELVSDRWRAREAAATAEVVERGSTGEYEIELMKEDGTVLPVAIKK